MAVGVGPNGDGNAIRGVHTWSQLALPTHLIAGIPVRASCVTSATGRVRVVLHSPGPQACGDTLPSNAPTTAGETLRLLRQPGDTLDACTACCDDDSIANLDNLLFDLDVLARRIDMCTRLRDALNRPGTLDAFSAASAVAMLRRCTEVVIPDEHLAEWTTDLLTASMEDWWRQQQASYSDAADTARARLRESQSGWDGPLRLLTPTPGLLLAAGPEPLVWWNATGDVLACTAAADIVALTTCTVAEIRPVFAVPAHVALNAPKPWLDLGPVRTGGSLAGLVAAFSAVADQVEDVDQAIADAVVYAADQEPSCI